MDERLFEQYISEHMSSNSVKTETIQRYIEHRLPANVVPGFEKRVLNNLLSQERMFHLAPETLAQLHLRHGVGSVLLPQVNRTLLEEGKYEAAAKVIFFAVFEGQEREAYVTWDRICGIYADMRRQDLSGQRYRRAGGFGLVGTSSEIEQVCWGLLQMCDEITEGIEKEGWDWTRTLVKRHLDNLPVKRRLRREAAQQTMQIIFA